MTSLNALVAQLESTGAEPGSIQSPSIDWLSLTPLIALVTGALVLLVVNALVAAKLRPGVNAVLAVLSGGTALGTALWQWIRVDDDGALLTVADAVVIDGFAVFLTILISCAVIVVSLVADDYLRREDLDGPELYGLLLLSAAGGVLMAISNDLVLLFLGLETLSIALYVMAGFHLRRTQSQEAAVKYFVLGAFSSAFLLYGIALLYGATGTTNMIEIAEFLARTTIVDDGLLLGGLALVLVGLGFKVAAVPFHMWTPDVYEGSPTPVVGFMASVAKAAGFAGLLRLFASTLSVLEQDWRPMIWVLAALTLVTGSVLAVVQRNVKRLLAYSSISHAGYVLLGLQAASDDGVAGSLFYLLAYTFMVLGTFTVVTLVARRGDAAHDLDDYAGLGRRHPWLAFTLTVLLLSQAGVPFTSGFFAKVYVIQAAVDAGSYVLAVVAMLAAAVAAFLYLKVIVAMYLREPESDDEPAPLPLPVGARIALAATFGFTVVVGFVPSVVINFARSATLLS